MENNDHSFVIGGIIGVLVMYLVRGIYRHPVIALFVLLAYWLGESLFWG